MHKDNMSCPWKCDINSKDVQEHILKCQVILNKLQDTELEAAKDVAYSYIYRDTHQQKSVVTLILRLLQHLPVGHHWSRHCWLAWEATETSLHTSFSTVKYIIRPPIPKEITDSLMKSRIVYQILIGQRTLLDIYTCSVF